MTPDTVAEGRGSVWRAALIESGLGTAAVFAVPQPGDPGGTVTFRGGATFLRSAELTGETDPAQFSVPDG